MASKGKLNLVSVGPGFINLVPPLAEFALRESEVVVGYKLYFTWIQPLLEGKEIHSFSLTQERERAQKAIACARDRKDGQPGLKRRHWYLRDGFARSRGNERRGRVSASDHSWCFRGEQFRRAAGCTAVPRFRHLIAFRSFMPVGMDRESRPPSGGGRPGDSSLQCPEPIQAGRYLPDSAHFNGREERKHLVWRCTKRIPS